MVREDQDDEEGLRDAEDCLPLRRLADLEDEDEVPLHVLVEEAPVQDRRRVPDRLLPAELPPGAGHSGHQRDALDDGACLVAPDAPGPSQVLSELQRAPPPHVLDGFGGHRPEAPRHAGALQAVRGVDRQEVDNLQVPAAQEVRADAAAAAAAAAGPLDEAQPAELGVEALVPQTVAPDVAQHLQLPEVTITNVTINNVTITVTITILYYYYHYYYYYYYYYHLQLPVRPELKRRGRAGREHGGLVVVRC